MFLLNEFFLKKVYSLFWGPGGFISKTLGRLSFSPSVDSFSTFEIITLFPQRSGFLVTRSEHRF